MQRATYSKPSSKIASASAAGVISRALEAVPLPALLRALTVQVWVVPLLRPLTVIGLVVLVAATGPGVQLTV